MPHNSLQFVTTALSDIPWIKHGFFSRHGGVGQGFYGSLNCAWGAKDKEENTQENRARVAKSLGLQPDNLVTLPQVHSADAITVSEPLTRHNAPQADGLATSMPGIGLGILTADCAPVLFASKKDKIIGAAHAGWKGAATGVLETTLSEMEKLGAKRKDIVAAIGPCIGPQSYEVSEAFQLPFIEQDKDNARFFRAAEKQGHLMFDLPGYAAHRLKVYGIETVYDTKRDTLPDEHTYFSYRRSTLRKEPDYGRQISVIAIGA